MEKINHIILTRMNFSDESLLDKYLKIVKEVYVPSLKSQTNKNFKVAIITNEKILPKLKKEIDFDFVPFFNIHKFNEFVKSNNIEIQTRHDCDDYMSSNYIDHIQNIFNEKKIKNKDVSIVIHFQPTKLDFHTKKEYRMGKYNEKRNSMFLSLCQTNIVNGIFDHKHGQMYRAAKEVVFVDEGFVKLVVHGNNTLSCLNSNEKEI